MKRELPFILKPYAVRTTRRQRMLNFGAFDVQHLDCLNDHLAPEQKEILFEEVLRLKYINDEPINLPSQLKKDFTPFNLQIKSELFFLNNVTAAMALFPLDNSYNSKEPSFVHLWLFKGLPEHIKDHKKLLEGGDGIDKRIKVYLSFSDTAVAREIMGQSWSLACKLAEKALHSHRFRKELAEEWIITGQCEDDRIKGIILGNKLDLPLKKRKWLLPAENRSTVPDKYSGKKIKFAGNLNDAWSHISGEGVKLGETLSWPEQVDELHILIGGSIKAPFMPLLLTKPSKVVLWTSEDGKNSKDKALLLKEIIMSMFPEYPVEIAEELSSFDVQKTEKALFAYFQNLYNKKVMFNITSGTRLMALGAQTIARVYPDVELIYRDFVNKEPGEFVHLRYSEFPPYSGILKTNEEIKEKYNWDFLKKSDYAACFEGANDFINKLKGDCSG